MYLHYYHSHIYFYLNLRITILYIFFKKQFLFTRKELHFHVSIAKNFKRKTIPCHNIILELVKHTDAATAANGYQSYAEPNGPQTDDGGGNLLALICGSLCKDTPLAGMFGPPPNENMNNNNTAQPLMAPIQNGEHLQDAQICF